MEYKIYTKKEVINEVIRKRTREYPQDKSRISLSFYSFGSFEFAAITVPCRAFNVMGFELFALSRGFEEITTTGYRSEYRGSENTHISYNEIKSFWINHCKQRGLDLLSSHLSRQTNIFEF